MRILRKVLCVLLVLAMTVTLMGAAPLSGTEQPSGEEQTAPAETESIPSGEAEQAGDEGQPAGTVSEQPGDAGEPQTGEAAGTQEQEQDALTPSGARTTALEVPAPIAVAADVSWTIGSITYTGSSVKTQVETATLTADQDYYDGPTYSYSKGAASVDADALIDAGEYTVTATFAPNDGTHPEVKVTKTFTIGRAKLTIVSAASHTYDSTEKTLELTADNASGTVGGDTVTSVTGTIKGTKVGEYGVDPADVKVEIKNGEAVRTDNYEIDTADVKLTIKQATLSLTVNSDVTRNYTGSAVVLTGEEVSPALGDDKIVSITTKAITGGVYTGGIDLTADEWVIKNGNDDVSKCYSAITFSGGTLMINAQDLESATVTFPKESVTYNGEVQKQEPTVVIDGQIVTGGYGVSYDPAEPKDAGEVKVTITGDGTSLLNKAEKSYTIQRLPLTDGTVTASLATDSELYDGQPKTITVSAVHNNTSLTADKDYTVSYLRDGKPTDDLTNTGEITVRLTAKEGSNFQGERDLTFTIAARDINAPEIKVQAPEDKIYNGEEQKPEPTVTDGDVTLVKDQDYTISYSENTKDVGTVTVTIEGMGNYSKTRTVDYEITALPVTVTVTGSKLFGAVDPALPVPADLLVNEDAPADETGYFVTVGDIPEADVETFAELLDYEVERADGELPGEYEITFVEPDDTEASNYNVTFEKGEFTVLTDAAFKVVMDEEKITTHDTEANFTITKAGDEELIPDLKDYVDIRLDIDTADVSPDNFVIVPAEDEDPAIPPFVTEKEPEPEEETDDKKITFELPVVEYLADEAHGWTSGLPARTKLTATVTSKVDGTDPAAVATVQSETPAEVVPVNGSMLVEYVSGQTGVAFEETGRTLLDKEAVIRVRPLEEDAENVSSGDWIVLTVGDVTHVYCADNTAALGESISVTDGVLTLTMEQLKALAGVSGEEGAWFGINPAGSVLVTAVLLDNVNHISEDGSQTVAYDTGTQPSNQTVDNRAEEVSITLGEPVGSEQPTVEGTFGGSTPVITSNGTEVLTWTNVAEWKNTPDTLPHSGDVITISYRDRVGNEGTHTLNVVKSAAVTSNTIYVKPMTDQTVPSGKLNFYGETNVWEPLTVTIGGTSFSVDPLAGGSVYDNSTKQWSVVVDLSQGNVSFPVGEPTRVSAAYDELEGGEASIVITYKSEAQEPVMGSEAVAGTLALWGYVESSASVMVDIRHADGTVTAVPASNVAVDQFGYFYARLNEALRSGDVVVVTTTDFCGNVRRIENAVQEQLRAGASAEILGANIVGRLQGGSMEHRFATPVDLAALSSGGSMELPILAYKGIEIGKVTISLNDQGQLDVQYAISASNFVPSGAKARLSSYTWKPEIEELVSSDHRVAVEDLKTASAGQLASVDVSANRNEDGTYGGVIWLYAEFDVQMDVTSYVNRGGRSVNFYRWLTESIQTETLLNAVYSEMSAYEKNVNYYNQYQRFESISRTY